MKETGYRIILLLVVGLAAFSSAMKELNQIQQLSLDAANLASNLMTQWSDKIVPAEVPRPTVVKLESCEIKQAAPSIELPWLDKVDEETPEAPARTPVPPVPARRVKSIGVQLAKLKKLERLNIDIDPVQFRINPRAHEMLLKTASRSINLRIAS